MKKIFLIITLIILSMPVQAENVIKGGIQFDVSSAREELMSKPVQRLNPELIAQYLTDENYKENMTYLATGKASLEDRMLAFFSDSTYAVMYNDDKYHVWYYTKNGKLLYAEEKENLDYPCKFYKYNTSGTLVNMGLKVSKDETFIFSGNGRLIAHWIKSNAFDDYGNVIMTRKYSR